MRQSPTVRLRRLARILREERRRDGRTATEIARLLGWSGSTLTRMEAGHMRKPQPTQVGRLLDAYGVTGDRRAEILGLVREARQRGWWQGYNGLTAGYETYIGLESEASVLRNFEPLLVPGLLQTPEYARALITARAPRPSEETVEEQVAVRTERQQRLLGEDDPVQLWAVLDQAVLRRPVGGVDVARAQLRHLREMARLPTVRVQVVPYDRGALPAAGPFMIITFREATDDEVVYVETPAGELWVEEPSQVTRFATTWEQLISVGLSASETVDAIAAAEARLTEDTPDPGPT